MFRTLSSSRGLCCLGLLAGLTVTAPVYAADIHVPSQYPTITIAISNASNGDTIIIAPGAYFETLDFGNKQLSLIGSGGADVTTINAFGLGSCLRITGGQTLDTLIEGLTFTGGLAYRGAGIFIDGASATIRNCRFIDNDAILSSGSDPGDGGGLFIESGSLVLENCEFLNNVAADNGGGAYFRTGTNVTMTSCLVEGNIALKGAGLSSLHANVEILDSTISMNGTTTDTEIGGGLLVQGSNSYVFVDRCRFEGNAIYDDGFAVMARTGSQVELRNSLFLDNVGAGGPTPNGTIYALDSGTRIDVLHCTLVGNTGSGNTGLRSFAGGEIVFRNGIIWDNGGTSVVAPSPAGSIIVTYSVVQDLSTGDCCSANNTPGCNDPTCESLICSQDPFCCNTEWDNICANAAIKQCDVCNGGGGNISIDPMLDAEFALMPGSPAIDAADTNVLLGEDPRDYAMNPRAVNDPDTEITGIPVYGMTADMGAFEFQPEGGPGPEPTCPGDLNGDGVVNVSDLLLLLSAWGFCP